jgi:hypothetical protein
MAAGPQDLKTAEDKLEYGTKETLNNGEISDESSSEELHTLDKGYQADAVITTLTPEEERRILRKIDFRLVSVLSLLYLVAFVDRSNIGV